MEWYNILLLIFGGIGGTSGVISWYHAKSNKQTIDINNMQEMLNEAHKMYDDIKELRSKEQESFDKYKKENMDYIKEFKSRFKDLEDRVSQSEQTVLKLRSAIYSCYRCTLPSKVDDCPVLIAFKTFFGSPQDND